MKINKLQSAYLAGLIDGEGYLGILKVKQGNKKKWFSNKEFIFKPVIKVAMTDKDLIVWLYNSYGGSFETRKAHGNARESYCWALRERKAIEFAKRIYPYLKVKKEQAQILLRFPFGETGKPLLENTYQKRIELCNKIRALNTRGSVRD